MSRCLDMDLLAGRYITSSYLSVSRLFPVSQAFQLFYDFDQSLESPLVVCYSRAIFRAERILAVLFGEFKRSMMSIFRGYEVQNWQQAFIPSQSKERL
jgi:hypothetical protein